MDVRRLRFYSPFSLARATTTTTTVIVLLSHSCCTFMDVRQVLFYSPALPSTTTTSPVRRPKLIVTALACACRFSRLPMKLADFTEYNALVTHNNDAATLLVSLSHSPHLSCAQDSRTPLCHTRHPVPARVRLLFLSAPGCSQSASSAFWPATH